MPKISTVGLFSCDKFEETPKQKVIDLSKFKKNYFNEVHFYVGYVTKINPDRYDNKPLHPIVLKMTAKGAIE